MLMDFTTTLFRQEVLAAYIHIYLTLPCRNTIGKTLLGTSLLAFYYTALMYPQHNYLTTAQSTPSTLSLPPVTA